MTRFDPEHKSLNLAGLNGSVVVLTGGAQGIGRATVQRLHAKGAKVIFGDIDDNAGQELVASLSADNVHFLRTDVRIYQDNLALFKLALSKYGRVDHAVSIAGLVERPGWFDPRTGIEGVERAPDTTVLDVNLTSVLYFAHIACSYLAHGNKGVRSDKSLTLLSSIAGWKETPGMGVYQSSKHGVLGLLRALRLYTPEVFHIRVNAICPSFVDTQMVLGIKSLWEANGLPQNTPDDVAKVILGVCAAKPGTQGVWYVDEESAGLKNRPNAGGMKWQSTQQGLHGRALHVMGGEAYDIEEGLDRTESIWLGSRASGLVAKGQAALGDGTGWVKGGQK